MRPYETTPPLSTTATAGGLPAGESRKMTMRRNVIALIAAPLALAAVLGGTAPASAGITLNGTKLNALTINAFTQNAFTQNGLTTNAFTQNALTSNALTANALSAAGTSLDQLNGVAVQAVVLPGAAR